MAREVFPFFCSILYLSLHLLMYLYGYPELKDSDSNLHLTLIEHQRNSGYQNFLYIGAVYHIIIALLSEIFSVSPELAKFSLSISLYFYTLSKVKTQDMYITVFFFTPILVIFSSTMNRDDLIIYGILIAFSYAQHEKPGSAILVLVITSLIRPSLFLALFFVIIINSKKLYIIYNKKIYRYLIFGIGLTFILFLLKWLIDHGFIISYINFIRAFTGPISYSAGTIYSQYPPLIIGTIMVQFWFWFFVCKIIKTFVKNTLSLSLIKAITLVGILLFPYTLFDNFVGPRQSLNLWLLTFLFLYGVRMNADINRNTV